MLRHCTFSHFGEDMRHELRSQKLFQYGTCQLCQRSFVSEPRFLQHFGMFHKAVVKYMERSGGFSEHAALFRSPSYSQLADGKNCRRTDLEGDNTTTTPDHDEQLDGQ